MTNNYLLTNSTSWAVTLCSFFLVIMGDLGCSLSVFEQQTDMFRVWDIILYASLTLKLFTAATTVVFVLSLHYIWCILFLDSNLAFWKVIWYHWIL